MTVPMELYVTDKGISLEWDPIREAVESGEGWLKLAWTGDEFRIADHVDFATIAASSINRTTRSIFAVASGVAPLVQTMHRFHASSPARFGFVAAPVAELSRLRGSRFDATRASNETLVNALGDDILLKALTDPGSMARPSYGWFSPSANREEFGTPYLAPSFPFSTSEEAWTLAYVGMGRASNSIPGYEVSWRETGDIQRLVKEVAAMDPEYIETLAVLTNANQHGRDLVKFKAEKARMLARATFTPRKFRVKPKLTRLAVAQAELMARRSVPRNISFFPLTNFSTEDLTYDPRSERAIHAAARVDMSFRGDQGPHSDFLNNFEAALVRALAESHLGVLLREESERVDAATYWVAACADAFRQHRGVFTDADVRAVVAVSPTK